jgi:TldD protein
MISNEVVERVLSAGLSTGADFAEIFAEDRTSQSASFDDGKVDSLDSSRERGAGIRVITGQTTGFAYTADLREESLLRAARTAAAAAKGGGATDRVVALDADTGVAGDAIDASKADKVELLGKAEHAARAAGKDIAQVSVNYGSTRRRIQVANSDGLNTGDDRWRTRFSVSAVALGDTGRQSGMGYFSATKGFEMFDEIDVEDLGREASRQAISKLAARPAPSGELPVVIAAGGGAVLFHEACGHPLEADAIERGASVFCGKVGERVAAEFVTLVDDGSLAGAWGHVPIDDEGNPGRRNVLIDKGILTDYMWDRIRSRNANRESSGNGRRQTYRHLPVVRMTNTFLENGPESPDEIVRQTDHGVYVAKLGGGQVNPATGDFVFGMTEAYMIENGKITHPLRQANLIGNGAEVLKRIDAVANDFAMAPGGGMCGKAGQSAPVGMGQPTLRVSAMTIGGTAGA